MGKNGNRRDADAATVEYDGITELRYYVYKK